MNCVEFEGKVDHRALLTHTDKVKKLESILASKRHASDLFLPDEIFYGEKVTADDPERMADILFKWLGIKHRSVHITINANQTDLIKYAHVHNGSQITLGFAVLDDSFLCAAAVAHGIIHHLLIARAKISLKDLEDNEALTDLGTIYAGFGILILNAIKSHPKPLGSMGEKNYASEFNDYCVETRIVDSVWQSYVIPSVLTQLLDTQVHSQKIKPFLKIHLRKIRFHKQKYLLMSLLLTIPILFIFFIFHITKDSSAAVNEKQESISLLRMQYDQCQKIVSYKLEHWDVSDIFIQRQVEADKTRCTSIKNRYNYEVRTLKTNY